MTSSKCILVVGHCNVDGPRLVKELNRDFAEARVERINSREDLEAACSAGADLLLVNREPVGFETAGLEIIKDVRQKYPQAKVMLISDFPDAQAQALLEGAVPGFGKSQMGTAGMSEAVGAALG